jgi:xylan 1,4-beta-xylosidase
LHNGVPTPEIDAVATRSDHDVSVMAWNYEDQDRTDSSAPVNLSVSGLPKEAKRLLLRHYRIDSAHSNSYTAWKEMGSPQHPTPEQFTKLEAAGQLQLLESPRYLDNQSGSSRIDFTLPLQAVSLIQLSW